VAKVTAVVSVTAAVALGKLAVTPPGGMVRLTGTLMSAVSLL
jgi:hypothetical protein